MESYKHFVILRFSMLVMVGVLQRVVYEPANSPHVPGLMKEDHNIYQAYMES